jgi:diguanylate cyclase (GGDEF)-like protein/PAS domain S-box-containing protein
MQIQEQEQVRQLLRGCNEAIVDRWYRALATTGFVALSSQTVRERLVEFVDQAIDLLLTEPVDHVEAQELGAALARLYYAHPEALSRTQTVLATELMQRVPPQQRVKLLPHLMTVVSELADGFLRQARQTILTEQESIREALLTARRQTLDALRASEARFRTVFDGAAIGMGIGDVEGRILEVNPALQSMLGYTADEMRRMVVGQFIHPDDAASVWAMYKALVEGQLDYFQTEKRFYRKNGETLWCHLTVSLIRDADGQPRLQVAMMENITERKRAEAALLRSEARFRALVQNASDIITILGAEGTVLYQSPALERVLGYDPEELVGGHAFDLVHLDDVRYVRERFEEALRRPGSNVQVTYRFRHKDGSWRWLESTGTNLLPDPAVGGVVINSRDITESREIAAKLWHQAHHDPLTRLPNRTLFMDRLGQALDSCDSASVAVHYVDLDGFKVVNDSLGHEYGDRLLVAVAERLASYLGSGNLLARFGGDEFTVLQECVTSPGHAENLAKGLQATLAAPFELGGHELAVTASIGVVLPSLGLTSPGDLLRAADVALYRAKTFGKGGRAVFDPERDSPAFVQLHREAELRNALERGELRVHYQPQIDLRTGLVRGVEALVRWQHPTRGLIFPSAFIRLAEETGLIVPLGAWVLREACRQVMAWQEQAPGIESLDVYVNVSPVQFQRSPLIEEVQAILAETLFPPERLVLEITEQGLLEDTLATDRTVAALQALGVHLAIDDFGAYQAGLGYLRRWPIENLKLDRSLVSELDRNARGRAIVAAVVGLGEALEMRVIGEGVETAEQLACLRELGCNGGQGFVLAPPLPPDELVAFVERNRASALEQTS